MDILRRWRFPEEGVEVARLLVSELATNAIQHAQPTDTSELVGRGTIVLMLWPTAGGIILAASDPDRRPPAPRPYDASANRSCGLVLIQIMPSRWGYSPTHRYQGRSSGQGFPLALAAPLASPALTVAKRPRCSSDEP
ncbi:ATP-binding protein [Streptomyces sp. NPDC020719]|uniref:ATP-binding protein n=1 Tax=Streptomyces sp. NPDC020719 TaxID=3154896 RepID=UPI0033F0F29C